MGYCLTKAKQLQGFSVAKFHGLVDNNSQLNLFVWDPTEPIATRPLFTQRGTGYKFFYTCDGNKNVSEMVHFESRNGIAAHYDYAPFGAVIRAVNTSAISARNFHLENPFRFSSEYHEDTLGLVYYNYRHYNPIDGRWCGRDPFDVSSLSLYVFIHNLFGRVDFLGLVDDYYFWKAYERIRSCIDECPYMMDWEAGLRHLESLANKKVNLTGALTKIRDELSDFNDILSSSEDVKDVWNTLVEECDADLPVDITFENLREPLEKVINTIKATNLIFKLQNILEASPAQQVEVLQDIIELSGVAKFPILSEYFDSSLTLISSTLASIDETLSSRFFETVAFAGSCSDILMALDAFSRSNEVRILGDKMKKRGK